MDTLETIEELLAAAEPARAEEACCQFLLQHPNDPYAWEIRGRIALVDEQWVDAIQFLRHSLSLAPDFFTAHFNLAAAFRGIGDWRSAARTIEGASKGLEAALPREVASRIATLWADLAQNDPTIGDMAEEALKRLTKRLDDGTDAIHTDPAYGVAVLYLAARTNDVALAERVFPIIFSETIYKTLAVSTTMTVEAWCQQNAAPTEVIDEGGHVHTAATSPYSVENSYSVCPLVLARLTNGKYIPGFDFAIAEDGTVLEDSYHQDPRMSYPTMPHMYYAALKKIIHYKPTKTEQIQEDVLLVSSSNLNHFGYWLIAFMPRLRAAPYLPSDIKLAVPDTLGPKQFDLLALFGFGRQRLLICKTGVEYQFRTLYVLRTDSGIPPNPRSVEFLRSRLFRGDKKATSSKRVFAHRGSIKTRSVANEEEFSGLLREMGFTSVDMKRLSIAEQMELMEDASILMGVYGSNLFSLYFAPPGCHVLAVMPPGYDDPTIAATSSMLNMRHQFVHCEAAITTGVRLQKKDVDIVVDCNALRLRLQELI